MKKLLLLSLLALAGSALWDTTGNAQQAVTVLPDGTGTGTFNTPGITYYILPAGQTLDCRFGTLLGAVTLSTPQTIGTGSGDHGHFLQYGQRCGNHLSFRVASRHRQHDSKHGGLHDALGFQYGIGDRVLNISCFASCNWRHSSQHRGFHDNLGQLERQ